jgi:hypothetical protein
LRGVAELFAAPGAWTQHAWARDARGERLVRVFDDAATCWCLLGAIKKVRGRGLSLAEDIAQDAMRRAVWPAGDMFRDGMTLSGWNDDPRRSLDDVRCAATRAAELLEARP